MFELCVLGPLGSELKPLMFTMLRFLRWRSQCSFLLMFLVRLACLLVSVLRHWRRRWWVHLALLCRRVKWGDHLWFILVRCLLAMRVASVTERTPIVKLRSPILVVLQFFYELIMFLARCRFFVLVRSTPCVNVQFIQHFLWRATWQDHHRFISLRRHLSVRVLSATERMLVVVRVCSISCHARRHQETRVSSSVRMMWRLNRFAGLVWVCCMKCLSVVPGSFLGEEVRERNHCLFSGGLRS